MSNLDSISFWDLIKAESVKHVQSLKRKVLRRKTPKLYLSTPPPKLEEVLFSGGSGGLVPVKVEDLKLPQNIQKIITTLQNNGFLHSGNNTIQFISNTVGDRPRYDRGNLIINLEPVRVDDLPYILIDLSSQLVLNFEGLPHVASGPFYFDRWSEALHRSFAHYLFTPKNGWGPIHYIYFMVEPSYADMFGGTWSKQGIKVLDEYITRGVTPHTLATLLRGDGVDINYLKEKLDDPVFMNAVSLPYDWMRRSLNV